MSRSSHYFWPSASPARPTAMLTTPTTPTTHLGDLTLSYPWSSLAPAVACHQCHLPSPHAAPAGAEGSLVWDAGASAPHRSTFVLASCPPLASIQAPAQRHVWGCLRLLPFSYSSLLRSHSVRRWCATSCLVGGAREHVWGYFNSLSLFSTLFSNILRCKPPRVSYIQRCLKH